MHAVVMHPSLQGLVSGGLAGVVLELGCIRDDGVAPGIDHLPDVAGGSDTVSAREIGMPMNPSSGPAAAVRCTRPPRNEASETPNVPFRTPRRDRRSATTSLKVCILR